MSSYTPENLVRWTRPPSYFGAVWPEFYAFLSRNRDSDIIEQSNFAVALERLGGESETVFVVRENHWACGWIEWIAIHEDDGVSLAMADAMAANLADYPILCEEDAADREAHEFDELWERMSWRDRIFELRRRSWSGEFGQLLAAVRGDSYEASRLLNCPSDLLY